MRETSVKYIATNRNIVGQAIRLPTLSSAGFIVTRGLVTPRFVLDAQIGFPSTSSRPEDPNPDRVKKPSFRFACLECDHRRQIRE